MAFSLVLNQTGSRRLAEVAMGLGTQDVWTSLHLFTNDYFPGWSDDGSELVECALAGYAPVVPNWAAAVEADLGDRYQYTAPNVTITFAAYAGPAVIIYGAFVKNAAGDVTMVARNVPPFTVPLAGGNLLIRPVYQSIAAAP